MELYLSKSKYCNAVQCPKMLWMHQNHPELFDASVMDEAVLKKGNEVGDLARGLFGDYTVIEFGEYPEMLSRTQELLDNGTENIAEASFAYKGLFCRADILRNLGNNQFELYEVKSTTKIKDIHYHDVAFQYYVLTKLGYEVTKACLVHLNKEYIRYGELDIQALFTINDITADARARYAEVESNLDSYVKYLDAVDEPEMPLGEYCFDPYDCGYFKYCSRDLPQPNVFQVASLPMKDKLRFYREGRVSFEDIVGDGSIRKQCVPQIQHEVYDLPPYINKESIGKFMEQLYYPIYFLDFESFQSPIPLYDDSRVNEQIVFQYSLHYIEYEGGPLHHKEYLAEPGEDPRRGVAEQLCRDIPADVCVTAYNMSFEQRVIRGLAQLYPDLRDHLMNIHDHIFDLIIPFRHKDYYCKAMQGSYSIKYVLPALFPDDPALDYHNLEEIHHGDEASAAFYNMQYMPPDLLKTTRQNLLKYCELDTYAMAKIWERLKEAVR